MAVQKETTNDSLSSLLCNGERDFLIRNNGDKVKVGELEGKQVGLYFSAHWCPPCKAFTPVLSEIYKKLLEKGDFEILFVSADFDEKSFEEYHHTMPWLALPFSDGNTRKKLNEAFQVDGIPCLVFLDREGRVITTEGVEIIEEYGVEGYPFTAERFDELRAKEEALRAAQTVESLLVSDERDFVLAHGGRKPTYSLRTFIGHSASVNSLDFHPTNGELLCSCDDNSEIRHWSVNQGSCKKVSKGDRGQLRFQPDRGQFIAATTEHTVAIIDVEADNCIFSLQVYDGCFKYAFGSAMVVKLSFFMLLSSLLGCR